jgi:hypothetical protein
MQCWEKDPSMNPTPTKAIKELEAEALFKGAWERSPHRDQYDEETYYALLIPAVIEMLRGRQAAKMEAKRAFIRSLLETLVQEGAIEEWEYVGDKHRHDYEIRTADGRMIALEAKGCLDGNSSTIFEPPPNADEMFVVSMATSPASDSVKNMRSGLNRIAVESMAKGIRVDGVIAWDLVGSSVRLVPELSASPTWDYEGKEVPPPAVFVFPCKIPRRARKTAARGRKAEELSFLRILSRVFSMPLDLARQVDVEVMKEADKLKRRVTVRCGREVKWKTAKLPIKRQLGKGKTRSARKSKSARQSGRSS